MSTIKVNKIENTATADGGIAIDATGHVQIDGVQLPTTGALSNRNIVANGSMIVAQRGTSESSLTDSPKFVVDRFAYRREGTWGTNSFTMSQQSSGAPDGFKYFLRLAQSGTAAAPPANTWCGFGHYIEGQHAIHVGLGTSSAQPVSLSFYAKASQAGTYCVQFGNGSDQSFIAEYSVTTSWQRFTISIPARTTGTWNTDDNTGIVIHWIISADSDGTPSGSTGWSATNDRYTSNQTEAFASNAGATFDLCGVQLEVGEKATDFEHEPFSVTLARCQRYYTDSRDGKPADHFLIGQAINSGRIGASVFFPQPMRANASVTIYSPNETAGKVAVYNNTSTDIGSSFVGATTRNNGFYYVHGGSGLTTGSYYAFKYSANAEL